MMHPEGERAMVTIRQCFGCNRRVGPAWAQPWLAVLRREHRIRIVEDVCGIECPGLPAGVR